MLNVDMASDEFSLLPIGDARRPMLKFTKAELLYVVNEVIGSALADNDNRQMVDMVEIRHICNLAKREIAKYAESIPSKTISVDSKKEEPKPKEDNGGLPPIEELERQYTTLTREEIVQIVEDAKAKRRKAEEEAAPPPLPKPKVYAPTEDEKKRDKPPTLPIDRPLTDSEKKAKNALEFAALLKT